MKSIFVVKNIDKLHKVYSKEVIKELQIRAGLDNSTFYTINKIINNKEKLKEVECIFSTWYMPEFTEEIIREYLPNLKAVFYAAGTVKYFAKPFLDCGIKVYSASLANAIPVAEFVTAQIVLANKGYFQAQSIYKKYRYYKAYEYANHKMGNYNTNIGIIGAGNIGSKVIELLQSYNLNILVYDPYVDENCERKMGFKKVSLEELFRKCQVISNHLPDIKETKGMLNYNFFSIMGESATFINTGRGAQVVEKDLIKALKEKPFRCALLDVTSHEPMWPTSKLFRMKNIFMTPHIAGSIQNEEERMGKYMLEAFEKYFNKEKCKYEVNKESLLTMA